MRDWLRDTWALIRPSLDADIVNAFEKLHSEYPPEYAREREEKGEATEYYPAYYFIERPFSLAVELQRLRETKKREAKK